MKIARAAAGLLIVMLTGCSAGPASPFDIPLSSLCVQGMRYVAGTLVVEDMNPPGPDGLQVRVRVTVRALNVVPSYVALHLEPVAVWRG